MIPCKLCEKQIINPRTNQKFCSYHCARRYNELPKIKEVFKLDETELRYREKILKDRR